MRHMIHNVICWYLRCCGGAFHCYNYGDTGRYVVLMDEGQYARYAKLARTQNVELRDGVGSRLSQPKEISK